jgi:Ca-activated chloride channel homolog
MLAALSVVVGQTSGPRVELSLIVTDKDNKSVNTIRREDIRLFEDNVEQKVNSIEADTRPVDCVLVIDASGSFRVFLVATLEAAKLIISNRRPADEIAIERFISSDKIEKFHDFTTDGNALTESFKSFKPEGGQSAVIDAIYAAVEAVSEHNNSGDRRKVVVLFSDGEDRNSFYQTETLLKLLRQRKVQIFVVGITMDLDKEAGLVRRSPREKAEKLLTSVVEETGGRAFFPRDGKQLSDAALEIVHDLRAQFRVVYTSSAVGAGFRKIEVKLTAPNGERRIAITRRRYYVESNGLHG